MAIIRRWHSLFRCRIFNGFLLLVVCLISATEQHTTQSDHVRREYVADLTSEDVLEMARRLKDTKYHSALEWFGQNARFFSFNSSAESNSKTLMLQGYHISPSNLSPSKDRPIVVLCSGWTESTLKYSRIIQYIVTKLNLEVWSFDWRGQGFSDALAYNIGRYTHIDSFSDYENDLELFVNHIVRGASEIEGIAKGMARDIIYIGQSMGALIGLSLQAKLLSSYHSTGSCHNSATTTTTISESCSTSTPPIFSKIVAFCPAIGTRMTRLEKVLVSSLHYMGFGKNLVMRTERDISNLKMTSSSALHEAWMKLRELAEKNLYVHGPSASFLHYLNAAGNILMQRAHILTTPVLLYQAQEDTFVDNSKMSDFFSSLGSQVANLVRFRGTYHELLQESDEQDGKLIGILKELEEFIGIEVPCDKCEYSN